MLTPRFLDSVKPSLKSMVTSFKRRISIVEIASRPSTTPLNTKPMENETPSSCQAPPGDDEHRRCDSALAANREAFQQNRKLHDTPYLEPQADHSRPSAVESVSVISTNEDLHREAPPSRPDTPAHLALSRPDTSTAASSRRRRRRKHDRTSQDTDMVSPLQFNIHGDEDGLSPMKVTPVPLNHKTALTRVVSSRHHVLVKQADIRVQAGRRASITNVPEREKLIDDLEATMRQLGQEQQALRQVQDKVACLQQQLIEQDRYIYDLKIDSANKKKGMDTAMQWCKAIKSELDELKAGNGKGVWSLSKHLRKAQNVLKLENSDLKQKLAQTQKDVRDFELKWKRAESDASECRLQLKGCAEAYRSYKDATEYSFRKLEESNVALMSGKVSKERELDELRVRMKEVRGEKVKQTRARQRITQERDAAEDEIGRLEQRIENLLRHLRPAGGVGFEEDPESDWSAISERARLSLQMAVLDSRRSECSGSDDSGTCKPGMGMLV